MDVWLCNGTVHALSNGVLPSKDNPLHICIHGTGSGSYSFRKYLRECEAQGVAALAVDVPGFGVSIERDTCNIESVVEQLLGVVPMCPYVLMGHSLGAVIAVKLARIRPPQALYLLSPPGIGKHPPSPFWRALMSWGIPERWCRKVPTWLRTGICRWVPEPLRTHLLHITHPGAPESATLLSSCMQESWPFEWKEPVDLEGLGCEVVTMWGQDDMIVNWRNGLSLPHTCWVIPGRGHEAGLSLVIVRRNRHASSKKNE